MVQAGDPAPLFDLEDTTGGKVRLADLRGRRVVVYFYPKDDTPGCTREACDFRDASRDFAAAGVVVIGISPDTTASHRVFRDKHGLNFHLLADPDRQAIEAYGVWREKTLYGKKRMGVERSTFLIDQAGQIQVAMRAVKVDDHVAAVLNLARGG